MSGIDFRGRRRFRNSDATERLSALLGEDRAAGGSHAARGAEAWLPGLPAQEAAGSGPAPRDGLSPNWPPGEPSVPGPSAGHAGITGAAIHNADVEGVEEVEPPSPSGDPSDASDQRTAAYSDPAAHSDPVPHSRHREDVTVRRSLNRPALVLLCVVLLVALGVGCAALLGGGDDQDTVVASTGASTAEPARGEGTRGTAGAPGGRSSGGRESANGTSAAGPPGAPGSSGSADPASSEATGSVLTVHVVGEVKDPSVVTLSPGARVMDAVEAAGGFTPAAVKDRINLAENVADGAQIVIPNKGNVDDVAAARAAPGAGRSGTGPAPGASPATRNDTAVRTPGGDPRSGAAGRGASGSASGSLVNLNTATEAELEDLPKVGPVLAQRIAEFRTQHGPFTSAEQLDDVSGVGPAMLEALLPLVTV